MPPPLPSPPFLHRMPFLAQPSQFILAWDRHQICWLAYPVACTLKKENGMSYQCHSWYRCSSWHLLAVLGICDQWSSSHSYGKGKVHSCPLLVKCVAAAGMELHINRTAHISGQRWIDILRLGLVTIKNFLIVNFS